MDKLLTINNCVKIYEPNKKVLNQLNFSLNKGELVSIVGNSGCGKSTLLNIIGTADTSFCGDYWFENTDIKKLKANKLAIFRNQKIGFVFQTYNLISYLTVYENIELPLKYAKKPYHKEVIFKVMREFDIFDLCNSRIENLSGGEKQRVAISRAIVNSPLLLIADEPTGNLDKMNTENVLSIFRKLSKNGLSIIVVTHNLELASNCDKMYKLKDGILFEMELKL